MKKDRKRQIKNYETYPSDSIEYFGVFRFNRRIAVDPKRLYKLELIDATQLEYINKQQRNTKYFYPKYEKHSESVFYLFDQSLNQLKNIWENEYEPLIDKILTPKEYAELQQAKRLINVISNDEFEKFDYLIILDENNRKYKYYLALQLFYVQYFILYYAVVENLITKICKECGCKENYLNNKSKNAFLEKQGIDSIENNSEYDSLRKLYNLIKHGSKDKNIDYKADNLFSRFFDIDKFDENKDLAMLHVNNVENLIPYLFDKIEPYTRDVCEKLKNNTFKTYMLDYQEYYVAIVKKAIKEYIEDLDI